MKNQKSNLPRNKLCVCMSLSNKFGKTFQGNRQDNQTPIKKNCESNSSRTQIDKDSIVVLAVERKKRGRFNGTPIKPYQILVTHTETEY